MESDYKTIVVSLGLGVLLLLGFCHYGTQETRLALNKGYIQQIVILPGQPAYKIWVKPKMESLMAPAMASNNKGDN